MRDIKLVLEKYEYTAGDVVEGHMIVVCDKSFEYNRIHLTLEGKEHTRIVRSSGKHSHVYTEERFHLEERLDFEEAGEMQPGEQSYPFSFRIPDDAPSSYSGRSGWIDYTLKAKIELSWAIDPKEKAIITIRGPLASTTSEGRSISTERDGIIVLEVDLERDVLCLGDELRFKVRVARDVDIRGMRAELISNEISKARGHTDKRRKTLLKFEIDDTEISKDLWYNMVMQTDHTMPPSFQGEILEVLTLLKVTLDVPWRFDKKVEIPLKIGHCLSTTETDEFDADTWLFSDKRGRFNK